MGRAGQESQPQQVNQESGLTEKAGWPFGELKPHHYGALLLDPPWPFQCWSGPEKRVASRQTVAPYKTMEFEDLAALPVKDLAAPDCAMFCWIVWPTLPQALELIKQWGFSYKTCGFAWMKADVSTLDMFAEPKDADMGLGYYSRSNSEVCLLATRGSPKRLNADVRQGIIAPRREHSRKPNGVHDRIERLVAGPYAELFCRQRRPNWAAWGNDVDKFKAVE